LSIDGSLMLAAVGKRDDASDQDYALPPKPMPVAAA
jgi:hypothetical protein